MHFVYIDDSKDGTDLYFSALIVPSDQWREGLDKIIAWRRDIKSRFGIYVQKEIHATDWLAGRGKVAPRVVSKAIRAMLFREFLKTIAELPGAQLINATGHKNRDLTIFERMMNRIQKNMEVHGSECLIFSDEGKSYDKLLRKMRHFNHIPSRFGRWAPGQASQNIPLSRVLEDPIYRDSAKSFYIQAADACAFSLLRKEHPTPRLMAQNIHTAFDQLDDILVKQAAWNDPLGIIRV